MARMESNASTNANDRLMGPLTFSQRKIWLTDQIAGDTAKHGAGTRRHTVQLRFHGRIDTAILGTALAVLIQRHAVLRTTFHSDGGDPYQRIWPAPPQVFFPELDWGDVSAATLERRIRRFMADDAGKPFNLSRGALGRCVLIRKGDGQADLVLTLHRIIVDDRSVGILADDLMTIYATTAQGCSLEDERPQAQLVDAALQQWQHAEAHDVRERLCFWQEHLRGAPACAELETDASAATGVGNRLGSVRVPLGAAIADDLARTSTGAGLAIHVPLIAAWAVLLSKLGAASNIAMGLLLPRHRAGGVVGPLDEIVPFQVRACDLASIDDLLARIGGDLAAIEAMASTPSEWILGNTEHGMADAVLDRVMVHLDTSVAHRSPSPHLSLRSQQPPPLYSASFGVALRIRAIDGRPTAELIYAARKFRNTSMQQLAARLAHVAGSIAGDGQRCAGSLPLLSPQQQRRVVAMFNARKPPSERNLLLHQLFEQQVRRRPDHPALKFGDASTSYRDLNARANRLAHYLRAQGVATEDRVAVCMPRGQDMIVAMLGVLKAGAAYVPLDPALPDDRLRHIIEDSGAVAAIAPRSLASLCKRARLPRIDLKQGASAAAIAIASARAPRLSASRLGPGNLAYVIYTSGSTGLPKGVLVEHASAVSSTRARQRYYCCIGRALLISPISFDSSIAVVYGALATGGTLVIASDAAARDARALARKIVSEDIDYVLTVPEFLRQILHELGGLRGVNPALRLVTAGDACPRSLVDAARSLSLRLYNEYGPTEATVWASVHDCSELGARAVVPIGRPIDTARIYILDAYGLPVAVGMIGEICIGGDGVARGYMHRPGLTGEQFVDDPFVRGVTGRMYRTGDLGRWLPSGHVEFCGRRDSQVKLRGYRIELEEIEAHLAAIAAVEAAAVRLEQTGANSQRLVAYIVCKDHVRFQPAAFQAQLSLGLPAYMVPAAYVQLKSFPLTPNGKIDRAALPRAAEKTVARGGYLAPRGDIELRLAALWAGVLVIPRVGREDNFFQLGGDSLSAARLVTSCRQHGWRVRVHDLFRSPTLKEFARRLRSSR
ncbi:amino acid adenylation domain-containing protein [Xanthomonas sp. WHRI 7065]|uniref:non-ribosomal peptide synthetase n=1 Tax=Xanthomonas sp. WHRI 7065 TaxID=3161569 RepID=UPI0032E88704